MNSANRSISHRTQIIADGEPIRDIGQPIHQEGYLQHNGFVSRSHKHDAVIRSNVPVYVWLE